MSFDELTLCFEEWKSEYYKLQTRLPEIPFSNIWIAKEISQRIPENSILHLGILNSLRSWNFFPIPDSVRAYANTGGFGIDGCISTMLGASLAAKDKLIFGIVGDLALFYDLNCLGNRHFGNNIRLLVVNNGRGQEFRNPGHRAAQFGDDADRYIAAAGHYGNQSKSLVKDIAASLGFQYLSATDKETFLQNKNEFLSDSMGKQSIIFEVFTCSEDEAEALKRITEIENPPAGAGAKAAVRKVIGEKGLIAIRNLVKG